jgi:methionyl-tRNA synthetase
VPLGNDGDFTFESLFGRYNAELANDLGNLVNRSITLLPRLTLRETDGAIQGIDAKPSTKLAERPADARLVFVAGNAIREASQHFEAMAPTRALEAIWRLVGEANKYVAEVEPWKLAKTGSIEECGHVAFYMWTSLQIIARLIYPVLPATSRALREALGDAKPDDDTPPTWPDEQFGVGSHPRPMSKLDALFPRLDEKRQDEILAAVAPADAIASKTPQQSIGGEPTATPEYQLTIDDFMKAELRVAQIIAAQTVPKAKKLLQLTVDVGEGRHRTVVAGIAETYAPDTIVGRKIILVANLAPATIRGIRSEGMILAAGDEAVIGLSALDRDVPVGTRVR